MIKLGKRPPIPNKLKSDAVKETKKQIENKIKSGDTVKSTDFEPHWGADSVKKVLWELHYGKCCYCERKRDMKRESDVEHFRPKCGITEEEGHPGYWWLAYDWDNYFLSCKSCNQEFKKNRFPLLPGGKRAFSKKNKLAREKPVLIHPIDEDPEKFIGFDWQEGYGVLVKAAGLDKEGRGNETVNHLTGINKKDVMERRAKLVKELNRIVKVANFAEMSNNHELKNKYYEEIKVETAAGEEFAGFRRAFFRASGLGEYVSKD